MTFKIEKRANGSFWHYINDVRISNISDFDCVYDQTYQTFIIQCKNGSNVPQKAVKINDVILNISGVNEFFADVYTLEARLRAINYTPYVSSGSGGSADVVFKQESNGAIHRADITDLTGGLNSTNLTVLEGRASGDGSHADSSGIASGNYSHADSNSTASGNNSHADSGGTASGDGSHADSSGIASGDGSHADSNATASGNNSHADSGGETFGNYSHADSGGTASGVLSSASGIGTIANSFSEKAIGVYNEDITANSADDFDVEDLIFSIGIGADNSNRLTSFFAFKNGGFKFVSRLLTNITNATKGFFAFDENARPNVHDGTQWQPIAYLSDISASGITNLSYTAAPTNGTVLSDTGSDATIPLADNTNAGLIDSAEKSKIATAIQPTDLGLVATSNDYNDLDNIPTTFTPSSHTHVEADITDLDKYTQSEVDNLLDGKFDNPTGNTTQYLDGAGTPTIFPPIPSISGLPTETYVDDGLALKLDKTLFNYTSMLTPIRSNLGLTIIGYSGAGALSIGNTGRTGDGLSKFTNMNRLGYVTTAAAGYVASFRQATDVAHSSYPFEVLFSFGKGVSVANQRSGYGFFNNANTPTNVEATTLLNCFGICELSTSNNWHIFHNYNAGIATTIDLGVNFPCKNTNTDIINFYMKNIVGTGIYYEVECNGNISSGTITTNLPTSTILYYKWWTTNNTTASSCSIEIFKHTLNLNL